MLPILLGLLDVQEDKDQFTRIYEMYQQPMMKAAMEILGEQSLAQDALQEAFLDIIQHFDKVRDLDRRHQRGYVILVSRNKARDICRKRKEALSIEEGVEEMPPVEPGDSAELILEGIPEPYRETLLLAGFQYSPAEIAEILGESQWAIYKRLERGKDILRKKLAEEGWNEY